MNRASSWAEYARHRALQPGSHAADGEVPIASPRIVPARNAPAGTIRTPPTAATGSLFLQAEHEPFETANGLKHRLTTYTELKVPFRSREDEHELVVTAYSEDRLAKIHTGDRFLVLAHGKDWLRNYDDRVEIRLDVDHAWQIAKL